MRKMVLSTKEAAELVGFSVTGFRRAVKRTGTLPKHKSSTKTRHYYSRSRLLEWAEESQEGPVAEG